MSPPASGATHTQIAYNSCRNRHCPKCQGAAARTWLAEREAELLPVPYYHLVFTLPAAIADIAYQNKAVVYDLLFRAASETLLTIAADPKHLGARIGMTAVLHTWGSALTHHPHLHMIVPGGGLSPDGLRWIACRPGSSCRSACSRQAVPPADAGTARRRARGRPARLLRRAGTARRWPGLCRLPRAAEEDEVVRLRQAPVRRARGGAGLSLPLHPPCRHRQQPADRLRRRRRHLPLEGLPRRRSRPVQDDDPRHSRVHPPLPPPRPARRLPPHPPLRPVRQRPAPRMPSPGRVSCSTRQPPRPQRRKAPTTTTKQARRRRHRRSAAPAAAAG